MKNSDSGGSTLPRTLEEVVTALDAIIAWACERQSPLGYFPALYRRVTLTVRDRSGDAYFDDPQRMQRMVVVFANRYLAAWNAYRSGGSPAACWRRAFGAGARSELLVLQHLLLGMNAHINFDLAVAAVEVAPEGQLAAFKNDFTRINQVLGSLIDTVQQRLVRIFPLLLWIDRRLGGKDEAIANFSLSRARDAAWLAAIALAALPPEDRPLFIDQLDSVAAAVAGPVADPGRRLRILFGLARRLEWGDVNRKIHWLTEA